jgi:hypothetical protein
LQNKLSRLEFLKILAWSLTGLMIGGLRFFNFKNNIQSLFVRSVAASRLSDLIPTNLDLIKRPHNPEVTATLVNLLNP